MNFFKHFFSLRNEGYLGFQIFCFIMSIPIMSIIKYTGEFDNIASSITVELKLITKKDSDKFFSKLDFSKLNF